MKGKKFVLDRKFIGISILSVILHCSALAQGSVAELLPGLQKAQNDSVKITVYHNIFDRYQVSKPDSVAFYLEDGLKQFSAKNNRFGIASITSMLGYMDVHQGSMQLARKRQTDALKIFEELKNKRGIAYANNGMGIIEAKTGNFDAATKHFLIALKIFQADSNREGTISTYMNMGIVYEVNSDLDKSLEYFNKGLSLATDSPDVRNICNLYNNIGIVYGKKGQLDKALEYFQRALQKCDKTEFVDMKISSLLNMGIVYQRFGNDELALKSLNEALQIATEKKLPEQYVRIIINISSINSKNNPEKAIADLNDALVVALKIGQKPVLEDLYEELQEDYKKTGNYKGAFQALAAEKNLDDSTYSIEKAKEIANLESVYKLEESNATIKELKLIEQKNLLRRNIIIAIAAILTIALVVILIYFRKTRQLNEKLSKRETDLAKSNKIKDKLFSIIGHDLRGPVGNIPNMLQILEDESTSAEERKSMYGTLTEHVQASMETLDKLLYWGNSQIKESGIRPETFNIADNLQKIISLVKSSAAQKNITVTNNTGNNTCIFGDPVYFDFIFRNLLSNAIKFTHANGTVEISADNNKAPGFTVFAIKDNGIGIAKERLPQIFEPFMSSTRGTADETGTSIGLMLCKEFVMENGGDIWVESEAGKGSTFYFSFKSA